jgi:uncharacterized protein with HEPN domain
VSEPAWQWSAEDPVTDVAKPLAAYFKERRHPDLHFRRAATMRNILVHGYLRMAIEPVHPAIRDGLADIEEFARCILTYLESQE